jgi:hypothetical protein
LGIKTRVAAGRFWRKADLGKCRRHLGAKLRHRRRICGGRSQSKEPHVSS